MLSSCRILLRPGGCWPIRIGTRFGQGLARSTTRSMLTWDAIERGAETDYIQRVERLHRLRLLRKVDEILARPPGDVQRRVLEGLTGASRASCDLL